MPVGLARIEYVLGRRTWLVIACHLFREVCISILSCKSIQDEVENQIQVHDVSRGDCPDAAIVGLSGALIVEVYGVDRIV